MLLCSSAPHLWFDTQAKDAAKVARVTQAFLKMKRFNIAELEQAARG